MSYVIAWGQAFVLTLIAELMVAPLLLRGANRIAAIVVANLASHPAVWFVFPDLLARFGYSVQLGVSELWAVLIETWIYRLVLGASWRRAGLAALVANAASVTLGAVLL